MLSFGRVGVWKKEARPTLQGEDLQKSKTELGSVDHHGPLRRACPQAWRLRTWQ